MGQRYYPGIRVAPWWRLLCERRARVGRPLTCLKLEVRLPDQRVVLPGDPFPLGATWDRKGTNFVLFSEHATGVQLCLYDAGGAEECVPLNQSPGFLWHGYLP